MDCDRGNRDARHGFGHPFCADTGSNKNDNFAVGIFFNKALQKKTLIVHLYKNDGVRNIRRYRIIGGYLNADGRALNLRESQFFNLRIDGCREKKCLMPAGEHFFDILNIFDETQIQHVVGFIQNQRIDALKVDKALMDEIKHSSRRGNQNINAFLQFLELFILFHAANQGKCLHVGMFRDAGKDLSDLCGEFPGRHHDQAFDACIAFAGFFPVDFIDERNGESRRFTSSRLGDGQNVFSLHDGRDGFELDIRRPLKTKLFKVLFNVF